MRKIQIFDPAMCCPTGLCGPVLDPELLRMSFVMKNLAKMDYPIARYNLTNDTDQFISNAAVQAILTEKGPDALPVVIVDGEVVLVGKYPSNEQLAEWTGMAAGEIAQKPRIRLDTKSMKVGE